MLIKGSTTYFYLERVKAIQYANGIAMTTKIIVVTKANLNVNIKGLRSMVTVIHTHISQKFLELA